VVIAVAHHQPPPVLVNLIGELLDNIGHSKVSMTQDRYMTPGRVHTKVADLLDRPVAKAVNKR
jgi:hypothetical protein